MNSINKKFSSIELSGRLLTKKINSKEIITLSEEAIICLHNNFSSKNSLCYNIELINNDKNINSTWENLSFEIKKSMNLSIFTYDNIDYLQWTILEKDIYFFQILIDEINNSNKNNFFKELNKCLYSIENNIPFENLSNQLDINPVDYIKNIGIIKDLDNYANSIIPSEEVEKNNKEESEDVLTKELNNLKITPVKSENIINLEISKKIFQARGEIYNYDAEREELVNLNKDKETFLTMYYLNNSQSDYIICTETSNNYIISIDKLNEEINGKIMSDNNKKFFCWTTNKCYTNIIGNCIGFIFDKSEDCALFQKLFDKGIYETKNKKPFEIENINNKKNENISEYKIDYNTNNSNYSYRNNKEDEKDDDDDDEENEEDEDYINNDGYEIMDIDEEFNEIESSKEDFNKFSLDSLTNDRTYCITDNNKLVSYKINQKDDIIEKISSKSIIQEYHDNGLKLKGGLLHKSENNILFLNENNPYSLYQYDLGKEKIISEWNTGNVEISDICSMKKTGQTTDNPIIYGINQKSVFSMDSRINNKNNIADIKSYSKKMFSNKIMSNNKGEFVVGTTKGELRTYDIIGAKAKNLFSFTNDPIRHIDISSDDNFILVTCDKYLLLIDITSQNGKKNGFQKNLRGGERKDPIKLKIKNSDVHEYGIGEANFTSAKFNVNKNGENNIITSLGDYVIIWNYKDIQKGKTSNYKIKKINDLIIDNTFKVGNGNKIVITMANKVRIQNQKKVFIK